MKIRWKWWPGSNKWELSDQVNDKNDHNYENVDDQNYEQEQNYKINLCPLPSSSSSTNGSHPVVFNANVDKNDKDQNVL